MKRAFLKIFEKKVKNISFFFYKKRFFVKNKVDTVKKE